MSDFVEADTSCDVLTTPSATPERPSQPESILELPPLLDLNDDPDLPVPSSPLHLHDSPRL